MRDLQHTTLPLLHGLPSCTTQLPLAVDPSIHTLPLAVPKAVLPALPMAMDTVMGMIMEMQMPFRHPLLPTGLLLPPTRQHHLLRHLLRQLLRQLLRHLVHHPNTFLRHQHTHPCRRRHRPSMCLHRQHVFHCLPHLLYFQVQVQGGIRVQRRRVQKQRRRCRATKLSKKESSKGRRRSALAFGCIRAAAQCAVKK